ncbi:ADAMTS16 [Branchiostoma lanceolatum]|uniref:ADAMTS16 protein n=1 Tax=Branchiostoma lanceolatum TaxID=7740 RepID=A0A8J9Z3J2_BRALA|nr:ADAMTS16 [Branchiostoma lanceolatum]
MCLKTKNDVAKIQVDAEWLEVFSTVKGTGQTVYDAWSAGPEDQVLHNKCPVVENWGSLGIQTVKMVLESSSGNVELIFDGQNTDKFNWFTKSRLVSSPWNDLDTEPQNFFSVEGDSSAKRSFYINHNYGGCNVDAGWLMVADEGPDGVCSWEKTPEDQAPLIMFSQVNTNVKFASETDEECLVDPTMRQDCGYQGIMQDECQQRGCCFDTSVSNAFFCFYKKAGPNVGTADRMVISIDVGNNVLCSCNAGETLSDDGTSCDVIAVCSTSADSSQFNSQETFTVSCPAGCSGNSNDKVWGTYIYTDDSSICRAAIHDGRITDAGGQVTVYKWPGQDSYLDTDQNGVKSKSYGSWGGSFAFSAASQKWRDDLRCGDGYATGDGTAAECNPDGISPCCSPHNWCGNSADHCDCADCVDYSTDPLADPSETCQDGDGASYRGIVTVTTSGKTCQAWGSQTPHEHGRTSANYPSSGLDGNFCRNPDGESGVWCYTTDPNERWELCDVPVCESTSSLQSTSLPDFYLEIALFVDPSLISELGGMNGAEEWSKVVMVGVQRKFDSGSLGKILNLRFVKFDQADTLSMQSDSYPMLNSFCLWQESQPDASTWDVAVLVVNRDLTSVNFGNGVLGRAILGGVCTGDDSDKCAIVEYRGYQTIDTIVHELGHNIGMDHDGDGNDCIDGKDIMATLDYGGKTTFSSCSAHSFNSFLKKTMTNCLNDEAENGVVYTIPSDTQPGELVTWDEQCKKALGTAWKCSQKGWRSRVGTDMDRLREHEDRCSRILCENENGKEKSIVPVEGSQCGTNMWCRAGECIGDELDSAEPPQEGGWSLWNSWTGCTKTCGLFGVKWRYRICDNPEPTYGGAYCVGDGTDFGICELQSCENAIGFYDERLDQCSAHNANETFVPYLSVPPRLYCKLTCMSEQNNDWVDLGNVEDGTYCHEFDNDICIDGVCRSVGCDGVFDSNTTYDKCGVCGGDGTSCVMKSGRKSFESTIGIHDIVTVPEGAKFVRVKELYPGKHDEQYWTSYLSVATQNDTCIISCSMESSQLESGYAEAAGTTFRYWQKLIVDTPLTYDAEYHGAGSVFTYGRFLSITEEVFTYGPLKEPVNFRYISVSELNVTYEVSYEFSMPTYTFHQSVGPCSKTCGYGVREVVNVSCYHNGLDEVVDDYFCEDSGQERPSSDPISCFNMMAETCKASWQISDWSDCSRSCAGGIQNRNVTCMKASDDASGIVEQVPLYECLESDYPAATKLCNIGYCDAYWNAGAWGSCTTTCGPGKRHRSIRCMAIGIHHIPIQVDPSMCDADLKPTHEVDCWEAGMEPMCPNYYWRLELSACSVSCGIGVQSAQLKCAGSDTHHTVDISYCQAYGQPDEPSARECNMGECLTADANSNTDVEYHLSNATMVMCSHFDEATRHALCDGQARFLHLLQTADQVYHFTACPNAISLFLLIDPTMVPSDHAELLFETSDVYKFYKAKADVVLNEVFHCGHEMDVESTEVTEIGEVNSAGPQDVDLTGDYYRFDYHNTSL